MRYWRSIVCLTAAASLLLLSQVGSAQPASDVDDEPPMRTLNQLDLSEQQRIRIEDLVRETGQIRSRIRQQDRQLRDRIRQENRATIRNENRIRELQQERSAIRSRLEQERDRFHQQVERQLSREQQEQWRQLRQQRRDWREQKFQEQPGPGRGGGGRR